MDWTDSNLRKLKFDRRRNKSNTACSSVDPGTPRLASWTFSASAAWRVSAAPKTLSAQPRRHSDAWSRQSLGSRRDDRPKTFTHNVVAIDSFLTLTIGIIVYLIGLRLTANIPEPVTGGILDALASQGLHSVQCRLPSPI